MHFINCYLLDEQNKTLMLIVIYKLAR